MFVISRAFMRWFFFFFVIFFQLSVFAQQEDSISNTQPVSQNRRMLLDVFRTGRFDAVSNLVDSIECNHSDHSLLSPAERLLLYYWIERYQAIDSLALHFDEFCNDAVNHQPKEQSIWNVLSLYSFTNLDTLLVWIDQTGCDDEVFYFRADLLKTMLNVDENDQTSVHRAIRLFLNLDNHQKQEAPPKEQAVIPKQNEPEHLENDPWRIGFGIGLGPTYVSGRLANYLSFKANMSFAFNVNYQRWYFLLLLQPIFAKLNRDIPFGNDGEVWEAGKKAVVGNFGLSLGYSLINGRYFRMSPFIGFSASDCSPTEQQIEKDNTLAGAGFRTGISNMFGMDTDLKLHSIFSFMKGKSAPLYFNLRLNFIPAMFNNVNACYAGNMFLVSLGVSFDISPGW